MPSDPGPWLAAFDATNVLPVCIYTPSKSHATPLPRTKLLFSLLIINDENNNLVIYLIAELLYCFTH